MSDRPRACILSVGTELTEGIIQDTHLRYLSSELTSMRFAVARSMELPDDESAYAEELGRAVHDCALVLITGGLGPTADDLTREVLAKSAGAELEFHEEIWRAILRRFRGRKVSETNRKQAMAPRGFTLIPNPNGTAPGLCGVIGDALVVALPGPPTELRPMFKDSVIGILAGRFGTPAAEDLAWGTAMLIPESELEEGLGRVKAPGVSWGTRVEEDRISFSLRGGEAAAREAVFSGLQGIFGTVRVRAGDTGPAELLTAALVKKGMTLATAESCTGGLIGKWMTDLPGSSRVYWGGFVAYAEEAKTRLLGVDKGALDAYGAVSRETVEAMTAGALERSGADCVISVSGIAGPDGGTPEKPVGTVWAAVGLRGGGIRSRKLFYPGPRHLVRRRTAAYCMLWAEAEALGTRFDEIR